MQNPSQPRPLPSPPIPAAQAHSVTAGTSVRQRQKPCDSQHAWAMHAGWLLSPCRAVWSPEEPSAFSVKGAVVFGEGRWLRWAWRDMFCLLSGTCKHSLLSQSPVSICSMQVHVLVDERQRAALKDKNYCVQFTALGVDGGNSALFPPCDCSWRADMCSIMCWAADYETG